MRGGGNPCPGNDLHAEQASLGDGLTELVFPSALVYPVFLLLGFANSWFAAGLVVFYAILYPAQPLLFVVFISERRTPNLARKCDAW